MSEYILGERFEYKQSWGPGRDVVADDGEVYTWDGSGIYRDESGNTLTWCDVLNVNNYVNVIEGIVQEWAVGSIAKTAEELEDLGNQWAGSVVHVPALGASVAYVWENKVEVCHISRGCSNYNFNELTEMWMGDGRGVTVLRLGLGEEL